MRGTLECSWNQTSDVSCSYSIEHRHYSDNVPGDESGLGVRLRKYEVRLNCSVCKWGDEGGG